MSSVKSRSGRIHPEAERNEDAGSKHLSRASTLSRQASVVRRDRAAAAAAAAAAEEERAKGLLLPEEEYGAWLQERIKRDGRRGAAALLRVYGRMLAPVALVCVLMFALMGSLSYAIPNLLCNRVSKENSGASFGLLECIYNDVGQEGGYSVRWGAKLFWLFFWSMEHAWMAFFPGLLAMAMFGPALRRAEYVKIGFFTLLCASVAPIAGPRFGLALSNMGIVMGTALAATLVTLNMMPPVARYTGNRINAIRWFLLVSLCGQVTTVYVLFMPMIITKRSAQAMGGLALTFVRVVVHPFIWSTVLMAFRFFLRHAGYVPDMMASVFMNYPVTYASLYGRFLLLQMDSVGSVIVVNFIFSCFALASRLGDRASDGMLLKWLYGERARDAITATREHDDRRTVELFSCLTMESASILSASAILSLGGVATAPGVGPNHKAIWINAVIQLVTTLLAEFVGLAMEGKYHNFEWQRSFNLTWKALLFILVVTTFGSLRLCVELISLFCPVYYEAGDKILLEQCDKPSLFQAITFSSADRFQMVGSYLNITQASVNS